MHLVWFRNDLRLVDNPALYHACASGEPVRAVVCLTPAQWAEHNESEARINLWSARLDWLETQLEQSGIELTRLELSRFSDCSAALSRLAEDVSAKALHFNYEYPLNERNRDRAVCESLNAQGVEALGYHGDVIVPPGSVVTGNGTPFKVFTPFSRAWMKQLLRLEHAPLPLPEGLSLASSERVTLPVPLGVRQSREQVYPVSDAGLLALLQRFIVEQEPDYQRLRDYPARHGTSGLSPALTIGALSARQCLAALKQACQDDSWQHSIWLNELVWREFYRHLLVSFPELSRYAPFRPEVAARIHWCHNEAHFDAWKAGETGFPIVDAAMKQLNATGWMHNRLRMIVASFLTKLLRIDWRKGEAWFMSRLMDGDFASNLGGWAWSASVGADAAPYFRIFNPQLQSEKFDPNGEFVAEWLPELRHLEPKERHKPGAGQRYGRPAPIIDYKAARKAALDDYNNS
ncbi:deoxyribodipyrimidine photo-lyase [Marinobacterium sp. AK62]|uniref:Deoxyribodipyrimidine photo-lyase n=1 Tax=Marinobacterium alkalitolerans TaxID=1542925 RepID=A0ABS3ZB12_9GAMM|nr:deoxyribodipyrimidine photo-lyase [Marinobacterium alkalitolerans]MBP0048881.1 deoxyribodipyrimidine photo-lyase [Marinobacterium alkalitolerans]